MKSLRSQYAFSLVELIVSISLMSIISAVTIVVIKDVTRSSASLDRRNEESNTQRSFRRNLEKITKNNLTDSLKNADKSWNKCISGAGCEFTMNENKNSTIFTPITLNISQHLTPFSANSAGKFCGQTTSAKCPLWVHARARPICANASDNCKTILGINLQLIIETHFQENSKLQRPILQMLSSHISLKLPVSASQVSKPVPISFPDAIANQNPDPDCPQYPSSGCFENNETCSIYIEKCKVRYTSPLAHCEAWTVEPNPLNPHPASSTCWAVLHD